MIDWAEHWRSDLGGWGPYSAPGAHAKRPGADDWRRAIGRECALVAVARGEGTVCRALSAFGQRYPEVSRSQGVEWVVGCIKQVLPVAREQGVVLALEQIAESFAFLRQMPTK